MDTSNILPLDTRIGLLSPISSHVPPRAYGPYEQDIADIATGLVGLGYRDITLFATRADKIDGVKTVALFNAPFEDAPSPQPRVDEYRHIAHSLAAAAGTVDIVHNHLNYLPLLLSPMTRVPVVTTLHGAGVETDAKYGYRAFRDLPYISISDYERTIIPELNYVATIFNPIDFDTFRPRGTQSESAPYLVNVGRMHKIKGVTNAIELAKRVGLPLHLAGPVPDAQKAFFDAEIKPHIDGVNVIYRGNLAPQDVRQLVAGATAFVGLTEWAEPFGRAVVEAMACGTPVIASARGAHLETVTTGVTGITVTSVDEAVERFDEIKAIDPALCRVHAEARFGIPAIARAHAAAFAKALAAQ